MISFFRLAYSFLFIALVIVPVSAGRIRGQRTADYVDNMDDTHYHRRENLPSIWDDGKHHGKKGKGNNHFFHHDKGKGHIGGFHYDTHGGAHHKGAGCFHGSARVEMENGTTEAMQEVQVGDRIMSVDDGGQREYVDVVYVPHLHNEIDETFLKVSCKLDSSGRSTDGETEESSPITITTLLVTPGHFVFATTSIESQFEYAIPIQAEAMLHTEMNDTPLWLWVMPAGGNPNNQVERCEIVSLDITKEKGVYTLFTSNGRMIVDGLVVSSYAATSSGWVNYDHNMAHSAAILHRFMFAMGLGSNTCFRSLNDYVLAPLFA